MDFRSAAAAGLCLPPMGLASGLPVGPPLPLHSTGLPPPPTPFNPVGTGLTSGMYMYSAPPPIATGSPMITSVQQGMVVHSIKKITYIDIQRLNFYIFHSVKVFNIINLHSQIQKFNNKYYRY